MSEKEENKYVMIISDIKSLKKVIESYLSSKLVICKVDLVLFWRKHLNPNNKEEICTKILIEAIILKCYISNY